MTARARPIQILLVEDNPGDVRLTREALRDVKIRNVLTVAHDGIEAMRMLRREGEHASLSLPDLVLLDLNLPGMSGQEVLREIKTDPDLRQVPVIIVTSSEAEEDVLKSYQLQCNAFVTKPLALEQFVKVVRSIEQFWLEIVKLP